MKSISEMAKKIANTEGLKKETNIAQIKEVLRIAAIMLSDDEELEFYFKKYGAKKSKEIGK